MITNSTKIKLKSINNLPSKKIIIYYSLILLLAFFQLFYKLDKLPIRIWDEGKNAVSAYEMLHNKNYLVRYYEGQPDTWGFKPPLLTWHQVVLMKIIGVNEWAVRLPSALYALFTVLLLFRFSKNELKLPLVGLLAAFVLLTSFGYLERHIVRSGDHDSMLVFFLTVQLIYFYKYLKYPEKRNRNILIICLALILGTLTKGVAALLFVPGFVIYTIHQRKVNYLLRHRMIYGAVLAYILVIGGYYLFRELNSPGYLSALWDNELLPRYTNTAPYYKYANLHDYFYYIRNLWQIRLVPWIYALPPFLITLFFLKNGPCKSVYTYLLWISVSFLIIISFGTKNPWYDAPIFPLTALITAMGIYQWMHFLYNLRVWIYLRWSMIILISLILIYFPIQSTKRLTFQIQERPWVYDVQGISYFLRDELRKKETIKDLGVACDVYHSHIRFYMDQLNGSGSKLYFADYKNLKPKMKVIASEQLVKEYIEQNYDCTKIVEKNNATIYTIKGPK